MNEPAIFYSEEGLRECFSYIDSIRGKNIGIEENENLMNVVLGLANNPKDYDRFYHHVNDTSIVHTKLHNLFGYNMTRAAAEGFASIDDSKRFYYFPVLPISACIVMAVSGLEIIVPGGHTYY